MNVTGKQKNNDTRRKSNETSAKATLTLIELQFAKK